MHDEEDLVIRVAPARRSHHQGTGRIHRSNLIGMGVLPLQFPNGESAGSLGGSGPAIVRALGGALITLGVVALLLAGYELYGSARITRYEQRQAAADLDQYRRTGPEPAGAQAEPPAPRQPFARIYIPRFGPDWSFTIAEGVGQDVLAAVPGITRRPPYRADPATSPSPATGSGAARPSAPPTSS
ncbi:hypothetical protein HF519_08705 [Pseudonocardia bannensis]|uniref:Uncharacterized protein n=1 Tax=Pseudonocardia bannensis TaxID=630973 RepID=A0A848DGL1_9PSEU|nr:hypothetical protein [Pseudonocardia bannensis]NMH91661.1 hypothetical protein [Pseudonocardia bannensis]